MLRFFNKKKPPVTYPGFSWLAQDIHSHLLPGIDDGSPDVETSLELIRALGQAGIKKFICTPHIIGDMYRNTPETINQALSKLKAGLTKAGMDVDIRAAAEYMLDDYFMELLRTKKPLLTLEKNFLLTELSYSAQPDKLEEISFEIQTNNYQPLMAHPERYHYYHKNYKAYDHLKDLGFLLQVNLLSLAGYYGKSVAKAARHIIDRGMADFVGTDLHHFNHLAALTDVRSVELFETYLGHRKFNEFPS